MGLLSHAEKAVRWLALSSHESHTYDSYCVHTWMPLCSYSTAAFYSGVTSASCSSPDHWLQQKSPHCKLMPSSSKHSPTSSYISNFHLFKCPLVWVCLLVDLFIQCSRTHKPLASFEGQVPGFIVHGTSLHRSSPAITDNATYSDTFQLGINIATVGVSLTSVYICLLILQTWHKCYIQKSWL